MDAISSRQPVAFGVIFDGDDTLWITENLYDDARSRVRRIVDNAGVDGAAWEERERSIDVQNVAKYGFGMERFPASCIQAYEEMHHPPDRRIVEKIREAACSAFERAPMLVPGAKETLTVLRARGARLALLTKGDTELQLRRVNGSGLREFFDVVKIAQEKSPALIREVVAALGVDLQSTWMVGNSIRSDVIPAIKAGIRAVQIPAHGWEFEHDYEHSSPAGLIRASRLVDIPALIMS